MDQLVEAPGPPRFHMDLQWRGPLGPKYVGFGIWHMPQSVTIAFWPVSMQFTYGKWYRFTEPTEEKDESEEN